MITISIAICTRNRADSLGRTLASLARSHGALAPESPHVWELLVVDNGSSDHTVAAIRENASGLPLTLVSEPRTGLSNARNAALARFRGEWIAFTDDDAEVEENYLHALLHAIATHPDMDFFGGRSRVKWPSVAPAWLGDPDLPFIKGLLCSFDEGALDHELSPGLIPFGVNMGMRREMVENLAPFRDDLGPGTPARGEETEYLRRALAKGYRGFYLGSVGVWHHADSTRFGIGALYRHGIAKGRGDRIMNPSTPSRGSMHEEAWQLLAAMWHALKGKHDWMRVCVVNAGRQRGLRQSRDRTPRRRSS